MYISMEEEEEEPGLHISARRTEEADGDGCDESRNQ